MSAKLFIVLANIELFLAQEVGDHRRRRMWEDEFTKCVYFGILSYGMLKVPLELLSNKWRYIAPSLLCQNEDFSY
jgi:hypothetical protein